MAGLGEGPARRPSRDLDTFPNPQPDREYEISLTCPEFTCLCPVTGQPDFATFTIRYVPAATCVELKSLKLYLWSYRDEGAFHEAVTNQVLDDLVAALAPRRIEVEADFNVRGGIHTVVTAKYPESAGNRVNSHAVAAQSGEGGTVDLSQIPLDAVERLAIEAHLKAAQGQRRAAAESLGIATSTLYEKLRRYPELDHLAE